VAVSLRDKAKQQKDNAIFTDVFRYKHPGFPRIQAIATLKAMTSQKVAQEVNMAIKDVQFISGSYTGVKGDALRTTAHEIIRPNKVQPVGMAAYFNTTDMKSGVDAINKVIREKMSLAILKGSNEGVEDTANHIRNMTRRFKSSYLPSRAVEGDLYDTIADSFKAHDMQAGRHPNQFISMRAGSYDVGDDDKNPTGVRGSRMDKGTPSLIELTENGSRSFKYQVTPRTKIAGTKRIKRLLKGRNIAGVKRK
tara:strand:- start:2035 stop:2787 length:753 start_codon:yes stop_codon:yes gene_type:complete